MSESTFFWKSGFFGLSQAEAEGTHHFRTFPSGSYPPTSTYRPMSADKKMHLKLRRYGSWHSSDK